jgi:DNA-binding CsgD family transcriptional regulator
VRLAEREHELAAIEALLVGGGVLIVEGGAGLGKTSLLDAAAHRPQTGGRDVFVARCSELEADFAFGVVRQLFERRLAAADDHEREALFAGPAEAVRRLLEADWDGATAADATFAGLHSLYWLVSNLADRRPLLLVIDDAHCCDAPSLRWLAHLAPRVDDAAVGLLVAMRPTEPAAEAASMRQLRANATVVRPGLLSAGAVTAIARDALGADASDVVCANLHDATGGNPFYLAELLRGADPGAAEHVIRNGHGITRHVVARLGRLDPVALQLAQSVSILGDGCRLRQVATVAGLDMPTARRAAAGLVRAEVLADADPPRFLHPIIRDAFDATLDSDRREAAHLTAARLLFGERAPAGQVAMHLMRTQPGGDPWVVQRLQAAAGEAMRAAAPAEAAQLLSRAMAEPPPSAQRLNLLRELARAEAGAGREAACMAFEEALALTEDRRIRGEIALEMAETYAALFRWVDAVDVSARALGELGDLDAGLADRLRAVLLVSGLHDARRAASVRAVLETRVGAQPLATGMRMVLTGQPASEAGVALEQALRCARADVADWDARAALLWCLVTVERYDAVEAALRPLVAHVDRSGSARGHVAVYSTLGFLKLRLGALPEADAAAHIALRVLLEGDFAPGLAFGATVLADVAVEAGELAEADALLNLLPAAPMPPGVGSVLVPAARGRLHLARSRWHEALHEFETCAGMFSADVWGMELRDVGYLHARSAAALALLGLGRREEAERLAQSELADVRVFGGQRALGVAARVAGLVARGEHGRELLAESVAALRRSPALLERAKSLVEMGAALRRAGRRSDARELLAEALDLAARCGARPLAARAREELGATGARPRRVWRQGVEALTPSELRVARLAAEGNTNRQIACALYVTVKTVEGHLAQVYAKLGIDGRSQLPAALTGKVQGGHPVARPSPAG